MFSAVSTAAIRSQPGASSHLSVRHVFHERARLQTLADPFDWFDSGSEEVTLVVVDVTEAVCEMRKLAACGSAR